MVKSSAEKQNQSAELAETIPLQAIAHGRSGDKGNHANIGIIAYTEAGYQYLREQLTSERVADYFTTLKPSRVERFELPGIHAVNFLLHDALQGGGSRSLRIDSQGKTLALALLELHVPRPANLDEMQRSVAR